MSRLPLITKSFTTPKGCVIRRVEILPGREAELGYDCGDGGRGQFPLPRGNGFGTYPSMIVKGVSAVRVPGTSISGVGAKLGFVLSPRHVKCSKRKSDSEISCVLVTEGGGTISGARRRKRRRR